MYDASRNGFIHATHHIPTTEECERHGSGWCPECQPDKLALCQTCKLKAPYLHRPCGGRP